MRDIVKKDILVVLQQAIVSLDVKDYHALSELSNHVIHDASIFQDDDSVSLAVLIYALSKVSQRCREENTPCVVLQPVLKQALSALTTGNEQEYRGHVRRILDEVRKTDEKLKLYIGEVLEKAKVKKASKMHEHGISLARTAELLGVSQWEVQEYIGKTTIPDTQLGSPAIARLKKAREWFA